MKNNQSYWTICPICYGWGKKNSKFRKQSKIRYELALEKFENDKKKGVPCSRPKITQYLCDHCSGSGLLATTTDPVAGSERYPHIAIIGAGIGGVALAVACLHRNIPFTLYEKDKSFDARAQGYGLTLQQASNAIKGFGLFSLKDGMFSTRHIVHDTEGKEISQWGMRTHAVLNRFPKRINVHIPRQSLRLALLNQLGTNNTPHWGNKLLKFKECKDKRIELTFQVNGELNTHKADLVVGADGIYSAVRNILFDKKDAPLHYIGYMVILGITSLKSFKEPKSSLLDLETVFQTVNGSERIYVMPFSSDSIMWQFSFPISENEAKKITAGGADALKEEVCRRANWHDPIPQIILATLPSQITGYPVYDRKLLNPEDLENAKSVTLIGDAAHPMTPFKGQGANQALLDALSLARHISKGCTISPNWREMGLRETVLKDFETEMLERSESKVKDSAKAAELLHSKSVLREGNEPKGRLF